MNLNFSWIEDFLGVRPKQALIISLQSKISALTFRLCEEQQSYAISPKSSSPLLTAFHNNTTAVSLRAINQVVNFLIARCTLTWGEKIAGGKETLTFAFSSCKRLPLAASTPCKRSNESQVKKDAYLLYKLPNTISFKVLSLIFSIFTDAVDCSTAYTQKVEAL